jgi:hypothetical protein
MKRHWECRNLLSGPPGSGRGTLFRPAGSPPVRTARLPVARVDGEVQLVRPEPIEPTDRLTQQMAADAPAAVAGIGQEEGEQRPQAVSVVADDRRRPDHHPVRDAGEARRLDHRTPLAGQRLVRLTRRHPGRVKAVGTAGAEAVRQQAPERAGVPGIERAHHEPRRRDQRGRFARGPAADQVQRGRHGARRRSRSGAVLDRPVLSGSRSSAAAARARPRLPMRSERGSDSRWCTSTPTTGGSSKTSASNRRPSSGPRPTADWSQRTTGSSRG